MNTYRVNRVNRVLEESLFFTGAGFSKSAGCKLSSEMLKDLENKSNGGNTFTASERKAIKFILSCLDYQARYRTLESNGNHSYIPNIEEFAQLLRRVKNRENLLPYPVTGNWSDKIIMIEQDFKIENQNPEMDIWSSIEEKIKTYCYKEWLEVEKSKLVYIKPFKEFIQSLDTSIKLDVFTLNNDLILETFFENENSVYTGFVSNKWVGFEKENIDKNSFNASRINYYKLHGSLDWYRLLDGTIKRNLDNQELEENIEIKQLLIFGHGTKIYTIEPFFSLLEYFKQALKRKKIFWIIGYSFFDPHINNLFFNELSSNSEKFLVIISPKISSNISENSYYEERHNIKNVLNSEDKQKLIEFFSNIQNDPIYTETPDFNIKKISSECFEYIKTDTTNFLSNIDNYLKFASKIKKEKQENTEKF